MPQVHVALDDETLFTKVSGSLSRHYHVIRHKSPDQFFKSSEFKPEDTAILGESWALLHKSEIENHSHLKLIVMLKDILPPIKTDDWAARALELMEAGIGECITPDSSPQEIKGVIDFVSDDKLLEPSDRRHRKILMTWLSVAIVGVAIIYFGSLFRFKGPLAGINDPRQEQFFHVLTPSPSGIAVEGNKVWISDWYSQNITSYKVGTDLELIGRFAFKGFSPMAITKGKDGLWSLGQDNQLRFHLLDPTLTVTHSYQGDLRGLSGLGWDGRNLWSTLPVTKELVQIEVNDRAQIIQKFPLEDVVPIGVVIQGEKFFVLDGIDNSIREFKMENFKLKPSRTIHLSYFSKDMNRPSGFGGDLATLWVSADRSGLVYRVVP